MDSTLKRGGVVERKRGKYMGLKSSDCSRKYLAKHYTTISSLQKDNTFEDIFFDKDLDDTPYSIIEKYSKEM
jgi:hypothetical protein